MLNAKTTLEEFYIGLELFASKIIFQNLLTHYLIVVMNIMPIYRQKHSTNSNGDVHRLLINMRRRLLKSN